MGQHWSGVSIAPDRKPGKNIPTSKIVQALLGFYWVRGKTPRADHRLYKNGTPLGAEATRKRHLIPNRGIMVGGTGPNGDSFGR